MLKNAIWFMTVLSDEAFAVMATCERTKQSFGITVDKICSGQYKFVWAFKIDRDKARREGYDMTNVKGNITLDAEYPGCPYCGEKRHIICTSCNKFFCYHGQEYVTCPNCGASGNVVSVEQVVLKGGGY